MLKNLLRPDNIAHLIPKEDLDILTLRDPGLIKS